jgi:hypothetical protein
MVHVFSGFVGQRPEFVNRVKQQHLDYCSRHGYEYVFFDDWPTGTKIPKSQNLYTSATWLKSAVLNWGINRGISQMMWIDTDSVFNVPSIGLEDLVPVFGKTLTITGDAWGVLNSGHIIARSSPDTEALFSLWFSLSKHRFPKLNTTHQDLEGYLVDQPALDIVLGGGRYPDSYLVSNSQEIYNSMTGWGGNPDRKHKYFSYTHAPTRAWNLKRALSLIHPDWRPGIKLVTQSRLNSYIFQTPGAPKPNKGDPVLHFVAQYKEELKSWLSENGY